MTARVFLPRRERQDAAYFADVLEGRREMVAGEFQTLAFLATSVGSIGPIPSLDFCVELRASLVRQSAGRAVVAHIPDQRKPV